MSDWTSSDNSRPDNVQRKDCEEISNQVSHKDDHDKAGGKKRDRLLKKWKSGDQKFLRKKKAPLSNRGPWKMEEDNTLLEMVQKYRDIKGDPHCKLSYIKLSKLMNGSRRVTFDSLLSYSSKAEIPRRSGKQIRERWINHLSSQGMTLLINTSSLAISNVLYDLQQTKLP
jgi:hypothetical protein